MIIAQIPDNESDRLNRLHMYSMLLDFDSEEFQEIVNLASEICETPISMISFIETDYQHFLAKKGIEVNQTSRDEAFCAHAILNDQLLEVEDAALDNRFFDNPLVTDNPNIRFYAGNPLIDRDGYKLGTLCVIDNKPRKLNQFQRKSLLSLSKQIIKLFELKVALDDVNSLKSELETKNKQLENTIDQHNKILSILAHDVKSPLNTIYTLLSMDESELNNNFNFKEQVMDKIQYLNSMIKNILDWTSSFFKNNHLNLEEFSLYDIIQNETKHLEADIQKKKILFEIAVDEKNRIKQDEQLVRMILRNIIGNAIKYTENGWIKISTEKKKNLLLLSIEDSGKGMDKETLQKIVNPKLRYTSRGTQGEQGSGLGLFLTKEVAQNAGIGFHLSSTPNKGTKIVFTFLINTAS
jgi:signal transduction histidine kinase